MGDGWNMNYSHISVASSADSREITWNEARLYKYLNADGDDDINSNVWLQVRYYIDALKRIL